jgi:hypothetical protein
MRHQRRGLQHTDDHQFDRSLRELDVVIVTLRSLQAPTRFLAGMGDAWQRFEANTCLKSGAKNFQRAATATGLKIAVSL